MRTEAPAPPSSPRNGASHDYAANLEMIQEARGRIAPYASQTPVHRCATIDALMRPTTNVDPELPHEPINIFFKCETFQKGGAFKFRGAMNAVLTLGDSAKEKGVVTHSSGNHAAALALAAKTLQIPAYIVVPTGAPQCKLNAIATYGGVVTRCAATVDARVAAAEKIRRETGASLIPPYDHPDVIAGQGTIGLEFLEQVPNLDCVVVPVSGGGMLSGIALAVKAINPNCLVYAAEPGGSMGNRADCAESKLRGTMVTDWMPPDTIADGLRAKLGDLTWPIVRDKVDHVFVVSDAEIVNSMRMIFERMKLVVEPSGAAGLAAVLSDDFAAHNAKHAKWGKTTRCQKIGVVLCGGNVDLDALWSALERQAGISNK
jgi:serine racemase|tara:strand:- start:3569 stop:4690 length:1122 start_codon:yes stop_codon:yes gene_type:complete